MPTQFLSDADYDRLNNIPAEITIEELDRDFWLSDTDRQTIQLLRGVHNQLGFGLQLGCLRYLGFFPEDLCQLPLVVIDYVADQLQISAEQVILYGDRASTQRDHQRQIQLLLGYRRTDPIDLLALEQWLLERALEHDKPLLLLQMACDWLKQNKLVRIGLTRLEKLVSTARYQAQVATYQSLQPLLTKAIGEVLDQLLEIDEALGYTRLAWLQRTPTDHNPKQIHATLDKIRFLQQQGVEQWDVSPLNPNRLKYLARVGNRATNQSLQRSDVSRRYPILIAFLKQSLYNFTDDLIEMVNQRLWNLYREAKRKFEIDRLKATQSINAKLKTLQDLGQILLDPNIDDKTVRTKAFESINPEQLQSSLDEAAQLIRPDEDAYVDYFCKSYKRVRHFSTKLLTTLEFRARGDDQGLIQALTLGYG